MGLNVKTKENKLYRKLKKNSNNIILYIITVLIDYMVGTCNTIVTLLYIKDTYLNILHIYMITATGYKSKFKLIKFVRKFTGLMICTNCRSCV